MTVENDAARSEPTYELCPECGDTGIRRAPSAHPALFRLVCADEACGWRSVLLC